MLLVQKSQRVQSSKNLVFFLNAEREKFMFVKPNDIKASWAICFFQGNIFGAIQRIVLISDTGAVTRWWEQEAASKYIGQICFTNHSCITVHHTASLPERQKVESEKWLQASAEQCRLTRKWREGETRKTSKRG